MGQIAMSEAAFVGGLAYMARMGRLVNDGAGGTVAVSKNVKPATDEANNMDQLSRIKGVKFEPKVKTVGTVAGFGGKNYEENEVKRTVEDVIIITTDNMDALIHELQWGLEAAPVVGGASVNAFSTSERKIYTWLKLQGHRPGSGDNIFSVDMWGYFELGDAVEWQDGISSQTLRFVIEPGSSLGTPIKFPTAA